MIRRLYRWATSQTVEAPVEDTGPSASDEPSASDDDSEGWYGLRDRSGSLVNVPASLVHEAIHAERKNAAAALGKHLVWQNGYTFPLGLTDIRRIIYIAQHTDDPDFALIETVVNLLGFDDADKGGAPV